MIKKIGLASAFIIMFGFGQVCAQELEITESWMRLEASKSVKSPITEMICRESMSNGFRLTRAHEYSALANNSCSYISDKRNLISFYVYENPGPFEEEIQQGAFPVLEKFGPRSSISSEVVKIDFGGREFSGKKQSITNTQRNTTETLAIYDLQRYRFKVRVTAHTNDNSIEAAIREFASAQTDALANIDRCMAFSGFPANNAKIIDDMGAGIITITALGESIKTKTTLTQSDACNYAYIGKSDAKPIILRLRNPKMMSAAIENYDFSGMPLAAIQPNSISELVGEKAKYALVSFGDKSAALHQLYDAMPSLEQSADGLLKVVKGELAPKYSISIDAKGKGTVVVSAPPK